MAKTKREIADDLKLIDVVIEILDSRIPKSSQNPDIRKLTRNKRKIILLNKYDLADELETKKWKQYFEKNSIPSVLINANDGKGIKQVISRIEEVMQEEIKKRENKGRIGNVIRVMIIGIPNVGKSSLINRLSNKNSLKVGNKPGVTIKKQWIRISKNIELLDTPGVLWPKFESDEVGINLAFTGTIKDEILDKQEIAFYLLKYLIDNYLDKVSEKYKIEISKIKEILESNENEGQAIVEIMENIGRKRGAIVSRTEK